MRFPFRPFAVAFACIALSAAAAAKADVIYTITTSGTITSGYSVGIFGPNFTILTGDSYTATQTFDATTSTYAGNSATNYLIPATSSASITVNGYTYNILANNNANSSFQITSIAGGNSQDDIFAYTYSSNNDATFFELLSSTSQLLPSDSLSQTLPLGSSSRYSNNHSGRFSGPDGTIFNVNITAFSLNAVTAVPEPRSVALFGAGLAALLWLRRRAIAAH